jgi:hypothetical protein
VCRDKATSKDFVHKGIPDWINLFCDKTPVIIFMHFGSWFFKMPAREARRKIEMLAKGRVEVIAAYDGRSLLVDFLIVC